ncbi:MAG: hypothetical protein K9G58_03725 [Bacteroidales bacterium]|nr:hypothetical protein [Bacteroidales bacterium]MCF8386731.1 hypothetical protein [Bacteroidales bacterium]MCF8397253.1 hypothetical protein [Bacteroidales bacterium]
MKTQFRFLFTLIFLNAFFFQIYGFAQAEFRKCYITVSVPSKVKEIVKTKKFSNGNVRKIRDEYNTVLGFYFSVNDMRLDGNDFSGMKINKQSVAEEIASFYGTLSEDRKSINNIDIDYSYVRYSVPNREKAHVEEMKIASCSFENIPYKGGRYRSNPEETIINSVTWDKLEHLVWRAVSKTTVQHMVGVDRDKFNNRTQCIHVNITPTHYTAEKPERDAVAVIIDGCEDDNRCQSLLKGIQAKLTRMFSKIPGLKVLERENIAAILNEIEMVEQGMTNPNVPNPVKPGNIEKEDVLVVVKMQELKSDDAMGVRTCKVYIKDQQSQEFVDPDISLRLTSDFDASEHFISTIFTYIWRNYFY